MLDDEIICLGSTIGPIATGPNSIPSAQRSVTGERYHHLSDEALLTYPSACAVGVTLHIEKQGANDAGYRMLFRKANTSVVHIGRRSGLEADTSFARSKDHEQGSAMFRCAVVSRRHAKIAFSDSGHAYLIDLGSHHGTHIRKAGEKFSRTIKPETSTLLGDGDIVTFGKSVGKGEEMVKPIVARIELIHAGHVTSKMPFNPLVVPPTNSPVLSGRSVSKPSTSGRYGVHTSSSSSDESYSSHSGMYSDIEEIPPPKTNLNPSVSLNDNSTTNKDASDNTDNTIHNDDSGSKGPGNSSNPRSLGQALNVLKRFLPPSQQSSTPRLLPSVSEIVERPFAHMSSFLFGPDSYPTTPGIAHPDTLPPVNLSLLNGRPESSNPQSQNNSILSSPSMARLPMLSENSIVGFDASQHDIYEPHSRSRSHSPMDLSSPSPSFKVIVGGRLSIPPPSIISAPFSPTRNSPSLSPPHILAPLAPSSSEGGPASISAEPSRSDPEIQNMGMPLVASPDENRSERFAIHYRDPFDEIDPPESKGPDDPSVSPLRFRQMEDTVQSLKVEVSKLHSQRRKYKSRFNSNVQVISEKLGEFDDRLLEVNAEYILLANQIDRIQDIDLADLNSHIEMIQENVDSIAEERDEDAQQRKNDKEDVRATLNEFGDAIADLKSFRDGMKKEVDDELASMKALHEATMARIAEQDAQHQQTKELLRQCQEAQARLEAKSNAEVDAAQTPVLTSLKRKRDDTDENEDVDERETCKSENMAVDCETNAVGPEASTGSSSDNVIDGNAFAAEGTGLLESSGPLVKAFTVDGPPPRKRARRFVKVVAKTATAVTVGAVMTWSALAFS
ncbi:hypothetical protein JR316_0012265 [Psilocybe cubensis]|uniref:Uncharacterized protein n=2 Tax=Psilocybe cubensis TaxID=181762 RepID=A0ACB8GI29_PSICU|nr:hypothetical protein JR316_0012265 [Psilocybe cubensis]KAH9475154.1 hypothetical protein JR316_0012265 [Psilocybe cubensis]